jgi:maltooligosyltrehalose trehalohydrolase
VITLLRESVSNRSRALTLFNFEKSDVDVPLALPAGAWKRVLDSADRAWDGPGTAAPELLKDNGHVTLRPESAVLLVQEQGA